MRGKPWMREMESQLRKMVEVGDSFREISVKLEES